MKLVRDLVFALAIVAIAPAGNNLLGPKQRFLHRSLTTTSICLARLLPH